MDAVEQAQALRLQRLGGGDVGEDHEVLDQPVGVEALAEGDGKHLAVVGEDDAALGEVEVQRLAQVARRVRRCPCGPERGDDGVEERGGGGVGGAVGGGLGLGVGEGGGRADQRPGEAVGADLAGGVEGQADGDRGAVAAVDQRAEVAGEAVGQHRDDAVGEVGGVAAAAGLAVEGGAGGDVMGDVGDRHPDDVAAGVVGRVVGVGEDGVVVVAGVGGVDGDEGKGAQVLAGAEGADRFRGGGVGEGVLGEGVGDAVLVDGDQRDRPRGRGVAEAGDDAGARQAVAAGRAGLLGLDELAVAGAAGVAAGDQPVAVGLLVDGGDAAALGGVVEDAEDAARTHADAADDAGGQRLLAVEQAAEQTVAGAEGGVVAAGADQDARGGGVGLPLGGLGPEVAGGVGAGDAEDEDRGQRAGGADVAATLLDRAVAGEAGEGLLELDFRGALQAEGAGDLALARLAGVVAQEGEDLVVGGEAVHRPALARGAGGVMSPPGGAGRSAWPAGDAPSSGRRAGAPPARPARTVGRPCGLPAAEAGLRPPSLVLPACWRGPGTAR